MAKRILVCDDDFHSINPLAIKFRKAGYDVTRAMDGEEAWHAIEEQPPDLLITDIAMPELDGFGLVERIRQCDETREMPVVFLSAVTFDEQARQNFERLGVLRLMTKPYSIKEMLKLAGDLLSA